MPSLEDFLEILEKKKELVKVEKYKKLIRKVFKKLLDKMKENGLLKTIRESQDRSIARNLDSLLFNEKEMCEKVRDADAAMKINANAGETRVIPQGNPSHSFLFLFYC